MFESNGIRFDIFDTWTLPSTYIFTLTCKSTYFIVSSVQSLFFSAAYNLFSFSDYKLMACKRRSLMTQGRDISILH